MSSTILTAQRSRHAHLASPMFGATPWASGMSMLGAMPMLGTTPRLPTREEFFTGLHTVLHNLEQVTRPPMPRHRWCACGREHFPDRKCDCGCEAGRDLSWGHARGRECRCGCREEACACRCCVGDADLIVDARLGEHRVVPIQVVNERRRERDVDLELSDFRSRGGGPAPVSGTLAPTALHLAACGEQSAVLTLDLPVGDQVAGEPQPDVDECLTAYADLRLAGCNIRPVRIAVVVLPRDCDAFLVECDCGCC